MHRREANVCALLTVLFFGSLVSAAEPPVIPIGYDALRQWDRWHIQRIGARAYMRSTYDRQGRNHRADASHFLYQLADDRNVTLDVKGAGVLYFARYNHWHGSPWNYVVDGKSHTIQETSTANPLQPSENSVFLPEGLFPEPLCWTWSTTKGADLIWAPISFKDSFQMEYGRTRYGTGYYIYHQFLPGAKLSQKIESWDGKTPPPDDVLQLLGKAGSDLVPQVDSEEGRQAGIQSVSGTANVSGKASLLHEWTKSSGLIRAVNLSIPQEQALAASNVRLRITWDDRPHASIDAPLPLFFGAGTLYNRDDREYLVKALPVNIRFHNGRIDLACYFPMPFFHAAKVELVPEKEGELTDVQWSLRWAPLKDAPSEAAYFHATYQDHPEPTPGLDLVLLDTRKTEGGGDWSGHFIGTSFIFSHNAFLQTLEGDPRFFFDDSQTPQAQGTGTEEWGGGGDYWGGRTMTLPFAGHPVGGPHGKPISDEDKIESAYRYLLSDLMPFGKNALIRLEHGGENTSKEHYETVTYWYGVPAPSLVLTDTLDVGNLKSEQEHQYHSPMASDPVPLVSRYEWGPDHIEQGLVYPPHQEWGRTTIGASEFVLQIDPSNVGVMLRRTLDYAYPNQMAEVFVADASGEVEGKLQRAGVWYLAGSNTAVYSDAVGELGPTQQNLWESNRRFRDDEFLLPKHLTAGRSAIRVKVRFRRVPRPLFPGHPLGDLRWSEIRYKAYSYLLPEFNPGQETASENP